MGNRLTKIYTRTGDQGTTALADGKKISKTHQRVHCLGSIDQLNAYFGIIRSTLLKPDLANEFEDLQHQLFNIGGELCMPELISILQKDIDNLEASIDRMNSNLPALKDFILPGGSPEAAQIHLARTHCRIAETQLVALHESEPLRSELLSYINRLSDWLFLAARIQLKFQEKEEVIWKNPYSKPTQESK